MRVPLSLRSKLAVAFLLILAPVLGVLVYDYLDNYGRVLDTLTNGQAHTTETLAAYLDAAFDQAISVGEAVALDPVIRELSSRNPSFLDPYLARYIKLYPQYEDMNVWDAAGNNAGTSTLLPPGQPRPTIADRQHFQRAMATGQPSVSGVIISRINGRPTSAVAVPIKDQSGHPFGVITLLIDFDAVAARLQGVSLAPSQSAWATDRTGRAAFFTGKPSLTWEERDFSGYPAVRDALSRGQFSSSKRSA